MRFKGTKLSKRTVALIAAVVLLLGTGGFMGVKAAPNIVGQNYDATIRLDEISVQLLENGKPAAESGKLLAGLAGEAKPGWTYEENISAANNGTAPEFVRIVVRKYWTKDGKDMELDPGLIELKTTGKWAENKAEATDEMSVYYCKKQLKPGDVSQLVESVRINDVVLDDKTVRSEKDGNATIYTYTYKYDGYAFNIEAEAQGVQTHNANDAIQSIWGVSNVSASGTTLSVE